MHQKRGRADALKSAFTLSRNTQLKRELIKQLGSRSFWARKGIEWLTGVGFVKDIAIDGIKLARTHTDPTVRNIPILSPNPEADFFETLKDFRFADGGAFDFRGEQIRSVGDHTETLANSNQRDGKGFATTYQFERTLEIVGEFKLDWIFVKPPALTAPTDIAQPHRFAPHFGRTLKELNQARGERLSDHHPITVDLPLSEPRFSENSVTTRYEN